MEEPGDSLQAVAATSQSQDGMEPAEASSYGRAAETMATLNSALSVVPAVVGFCAAELIELWSEVRR